MTAFDAAVLLVADGLVAVGRVLGGLRGRCAAEKHADALAEMEAGRDHLEPGDLAECPHRSLHGIPGSDYWYCNRCGAAVPQIAPEPSVHGSSGECPTTGSSCGCGRSAAVTTPAADNTTTVDHLEAAWNYHQPAPGYSTTRNATIWHCEGCNWNGPTPQAHARHRFQVLADMTAASGRVQQKLDGAS